MRLDAGRPKRYRPAERHSVGVHDGAEQRDAADEGRLEACGSAMVGTVIVDEGKVVRPSQLIASVGPTSEG